MSDRASAASLFRHACQEARTVVILWIVALVWTVGYCYLRGYQHAPDSWLVQRGFASARSADDFVHVGGMPDWVLFGILVPWLLCSAFTIGFCLGMKDDELGADMEEAGHGH